MCEVTCLADELGTGVDIMVSLTLSDVEL